MSKGRTFPPIVSAAEKEQCPALHLRQLILWTSHFLSKNASKNPDKKRPSIRVNTKYDYLK